MVLSLQRESPPSCVLNVDGKQRGTMDEPEGCQRCKKFGENAVAGEHKRIVKMVREWAKNDPDYPRMTVYYVQSFVNGIADRIEEG